MQQGRWWREKCPKKSAQESEVPEVTMRGPRGRCLERTEAAGGADGGRDEQRPHWATSSGSTSFSRFLGAGRVGLAPHVPQGPGGGHKGKCWLTGTRPWGFPTILGGILPSPFLGPPPVSLHPEAKSKPKPVLPLNLREISACGGMGGADAC